MMYLLTETAIGDSANYEVLSFDEVEQLKKEHSLLSTRIESTKRKLAMETKIRDAAQSLGRLYSPPSPGTAASTAPTAPTSRIGGAGVYLDAVVPQKPWIRVTRNWR